MNLFGYRSRISGLEKIGKTEWNWTCQVSPVECAGALRTTGKKKKFKNSPPEENEAVDADQDVAVGVDLQEVSVHGIEHEPSERGSKGVPEAHALISGLKG